MASHFVIEEMPEGRTLVVTGHWSRKAEEALSRDDVDGIWLNYARGYSAPDLSFVGEWPIRRLLLLDRSVTDLGPLARLGGTLEHLSVTAAPSASLDLGSLPRLRSVFGEWDIIRPTLDQPAHLERLITTDYDGEDLEPLAVQPSLQSVTLKVARQLTSLDGTEALPTLTSVWIQAAPHLLSIDAIVSAAPTMREFELESCRHLEDIDPISDLAELRTLGLSDCGDVASFRSLASLARLEALYAWGTTRVVDGDLSPLLRLPNLREIRMRSRRHYRPALEDVQSRISAE